MHVLLHLFFLPHWQLNQGCVHTRQALDYVCYISSIPSSYNIDDSSRVESSQVTYARESYI